MAAPGPRLIPSSRPSEEPVLVTGGSGFLGRAIVAQLRAAGRTVRSLQRGGAFDGMSAVTGDVRDPAAVARAVQGARAIVHAAGMAHVFRRTPEAPFSDVNEHGTDVVARAAAAAGVRHFVLISSVAVYGDACPGGEGAACRPVGPYAVSKAAAEQRAIVALGDSPARLTILRLATLYGEGDRGNLQRLLSALERGRFVWVGQGTNRKTLIHVDDAARACVLALDSDDAPGSNGARARSGAPGGGVEVYNVAAPPVTMRAVVECLAQALGRPVPAWHVPLGLARAAAKAARAVAPRRGRALHDALGRWSRDDVYPGEKFARRFDFAPRVSLAEGLGRQVAWSQRPGGRAGC